MDFMDLLFGYKWNFVGSEWNLKDLMDFMDLFLEYGWNLMGHAWDCMEVGWNFQGDMHGIQRDPRGFNDI